MLIAPAWILSPILIEDNAQNIRHWDDKLIHSTLHSFVCNWFDTDAICFSVLPSVFFIFTPPLILLSLPLSLSPLLPFQRFICPKCRLGVTRIQDLSHADMKKVRQLALIDMTALCDLLELEVKRHKSGKRKMPGMTACETQNTLWHKRIALGMFLRDYIFSSVQFLSVHISDSVFFCFLESRNDLSDKVFH